MHAKAHGARNLDKAVEGISTLDHFVMWSSIVAVAGNEGESLWSACIYHESLTTCPLFKSMFGLHVPIDWQIPYCQAFIWSSLFASAGMLLLSDSLFASAGLLCPSNPMIVCLQAKPIMALPMPAWMCSLSSGAHGACPPCPSSGVSSMVWVWLTSPSRCALQFLWWSNEAMYSF